MRLDYSRLTHYERAIPTWSLECVGENIYLRRDHKLSFTCKCTTSDVLQLLDP